MQISRSGRRTARILPDGLTVLVGALALPRDEAATGAPADRELSLESHAVARHRVQFRELGVLIGLYGTLEVANRLAGQAKK
jgi:hypothetical protein